LKEGETGTLLNAVAARFPRIQAVGEAGLRSGVVHRLDAETSGAVLFALDHERWVTLRRAFQDHSAEKIYRAVVAGRMDGSREEVMRLYVAQHKPARVRVVEEGKTPPAGTRRCDLRWKALAHAGGATLLEVRLGTGFLHQIRVMLAHLGHPVLGDPIYGAGGAPAPAAPRLLLHAHSLRLGEIAGEAAMPAEMSRLMPPPAEK
jgi:23S rRNA pseudouridine1911/1915/1917 synthase